MTTFVALLRGINVGGKKRVPMQTLRDLLTGMGCGSVRTHLNSGNAVFTHPDAGAEALAAGLEQAIERELGISVACLVREAGEVRRIVDGNPFAGQEVDPARFLVLFLSGPADPATVADLDPAAYVPEEFALGERAVYLHCAAGIRDSKLAKQLTERRLGTTVTGRNWNTVTRLADMAEDATA
ncbi:MULTISPECIES: DUF1697 domain-containing protein [Streptomyces]|uniref:DUF1697 domain-containing protein n=1 Tax=Streptomyces morookaense TaxID=1970 RepID=A0A7Y7BAE2_STRMO|nr:MULTISPECIES: DUF1697 domain-containing protein [Streptomyces]MCC2277898.1 DUF1697 domain-containing protein [Streptomyces sp. ET3-23]NVK81936.1 DUF1697 domain-containing protein [Streptomyces morookaense]GHF22651.1 hypothetical protein GCM10010359_25790 [Streptomyces morookaense]